MSVTPMKSGPFLPASRHMWLPLNREGGGQNSPQSDHYSSKEQKRATAYYSSYSRAGECFPQLTGMRPRDAPRLSMYEGPRYGNSLKDRVFPE